MKKSPLILLAGFVCLSVGCGLGVNKTIYVEDGETRSGSLNSVNGGIVVGRECVVRGSSRTVNGRIEIGNESEVENLQTVNGRIRIGNDVKVDGDVESINGSIRCRSGSKIDGRVTAINGRIELERTIVERSVRTTNGDILLEDSSKVKGDVIVEGRGKSFGDLVKIDIRISGDSVVEGDIIVEDKRKDVRVYLLDGGKVLGEVKNAEVIRQ